jgi:hypothetical protein
MGAAKGKVERFFRSVREDFLDRTLDLSSIDALNRAFTHWVEDDYHVRQHSVLKMRPIDRFGLDLGSSRFLPPGDANDELFFVEQDRTVLADNTFSLNNIRFEAPRDLRSRKIQVRFDRSRFDRVVVFYKGERMGEARPLDAVANDRKPTTGTKPCNTYHSTLRILCEAFQIDTEGRDFRCERRLEEAQRINHAGKMLVPIIDDAHLMGVDSLRRLRLLFEDFPKNHNLVLIAQPELFTKLSLSVNHDIKSRVTYSVLVKKLAPDDLHAFILAELDKVALAHNTFTPEALDLIVRSSEGILRRARNLCVGTLLEAVRDRVKVVDLKQVNRVLLQPHWRDEEVL